MAGTKQGMVQGVGEVLTIQIANPAAGAEFVYTVSENVIMRVVSIAFELVTDANVASRRVNIQFLESGGQIKAYQYSANTQAASLTYLYSFSVSFPYQSAVVNNNCIINLPDTWLLENEQIGSNTYFALQAGDQYQNIFMAAQIFKGI